MSTTIPTELLELKTRFDQWRETRHHNREPIPDELRDAALEMVRRHPRAIVRRVLKFDPGRLLRGAAKQSASKANRSHTQNAFFKLPNTLSGSANQSQSTSSYRFQLERPDGTRLTITIPAADAACLHRFYADFLRGTEQ